MGPSQIYNYSAFHDFSLFGQKSTFKRTQQVSYRTATLLTTFTGAEKGLPVGGGERKNRRLGDEREHCGCKATRERRGFRAGGAGLKKIQPNKICLWGSAQ